MSRSGSRDDTGPGRARDATAARAAQPAGIAGAGRLGLWWLLAAAVVAGVLLLIGGQIRLGGRALGGAFIGAGFLRMVVPEPRGGGLVVRSRAVDVWCLLVLGLAALVAGEMVTLV